MLVEFRVQNFASFNTLQTLNMSASNTTKENFNETNTIAIEQFGVNKLLKSAAIFGANAGGKTNLIGAVSTLKNIVLNSLANPEENLLETVIPFLIKEQKFDQATEFEVTFIYEQHLYRYGIAIKNAIITEEWLFWRKQSRETLLFQREQQEIKINSRSFSEAKDFIKEENGKYYLEKTRETVPFISVLSQFNGEKSRKITRWFKKLHIISGIQETGFDQFTLNLLSKDTIFKTWILDILLSLQIADINVNEEQPFNKTMGISIAEAGNNVKIHFRKNYKVDIIKKITGTDAKYTTPFRLESEGTKKLIYLLGPLYDAIKNGEILFIDEFDSKFHSLLSKFILEIYHRKNNTNSQLIITCHDTNLLTKSIFRRDQIWFVEKNQAHESELYSLLEYKEHYTRQGDSYSKDYLLGKYGAIPLFSSIDKLIEALDG
ncbi:hypothetical protein BegalDRAFT_0841 [Beggiatoa alba B18LD]|uniref:ATPase AAA-type core domain-containing protein n=1 Tax=Beggiatoa alba B18LD TaxID=395493 RepID=I3CDQ8_9GAMM|nr:ATP-binding protein [Beggiatoa alba]EIJ41751.1 hypothetical protein BegalDRAFT_0841 [Beggiatoa alba B18LD]